MQTKRWWGKAKHGRINTKCWLDKAKHKRSQTKSWRFQESSVGSWENTGCAREKAGGTGEGSGRLRTNWVQEPDSRNAEDQEDLVSVGTVNDPVEQPQPKAEGSGYEIDGHRFRRVATSERVCLMC